MQLPPAIPSEAPVTAGEAVRRGTRQCLGAGSMVALLLVLAVLPGGAVFAAPEAVGHISILLHEVVRPKAEREAREARADEAEREAPAAAIRFPLAVTGSGVWEADADSTPATSAPAGWHSGRCELFAGRSWSTDTPPPAC